MYLLVAIKSTCDVSYKINAISLKSAGDSEKVTIEEFKT